MAIVLPSSDMSAIIISSCPRPTRQHVSQGHRLVIIRPHMMVSARPSCQHGHCLALIRPGSTRQQSLYRLALVRPGNTSQQGHRLVIIRPDTMVSARPLCQQYIISPSTDQAKCVSSTSCHNPTKMCPQYIILSSSDLVKCVSKAIILSSFDQIRWYQKDHCISNTPSCHHPARQSVSARPSSCRHPT